MGAAGIFGKEPSPAGCFQNSTFDALEIVLDVPLRLRKLIHQRYSLQLRNTLHGQETTRPWLIILTVGQWIVTIGAIN
jgi:hypothetical protein